MRNFISNLTVNYFCVLRNTRSKLTCTHHLVKMGCQRENDVRNSVWLIHGLLYIAVNMSAILKNIDNLILYGQISSYYVVYQPSDTTKNVTNCLTREKS